MVCVTIVEYSATIRGGEQMKFGRYIGYGILTFLIGFIIMLFLVGIFAQPGGGELSSAIFNAGIMAIVSSVLFLCAVIVICTLMIINVIKSKK